MSNDFVFTAVTSQQAQAIEDNNPTLLLWGPGRSGKSHTAVSKGIGIGAKFPNNRIYLIRRKKVDLRATMWLKFTELLPQSLIVKKDENQMIYKIKNGTEFWGLGLDSVEDVNKLASAECGMAIIEEATEIPQEYFDEKIKRSVSLPRVPFHQTMLLCNPASPAHWIYKELILKKSENTTTICMPTMPEEAGILPHSFYVWLNSLTGIFGKRYKDGQWVAVEGLVYPFDPQKHIIKPFKIPQDWKRPMAVDFGYEHPFVCGWFAISPSDVWYLYRQIYMTHRRVEEHAKDINRYCKEDKMLPDTICDHDAENMADLRHAGIETTNAIKSRLAGQQSVQKLFDEDRFFIFEDSLVETDLQRQLKKRETCVEDEFAFYCWGNKAKEDMIKEHDDGMDMIRYAIHTTNYTGAEVSEWVAH